MSDQRLIPPPQALAWPRPRRFVHDSRMPPRERNETAVLSRRRLTEPLDPVQETPALRSRRDIINESLSFTETPASASRFMPSAYPVRSGRARIWR